MLWIKRLRTTLITLIATMRRVAAMGLLGCLMLAFVPVGCGSRLGPITAMQAQSDGRPPVPRATVERLKACMEEYGEQLAPGSHSIHLVIKTDKNGGKRRVTENDIPNTAPEFASCTRQALREMEIPAEFFRLAADMEKKTQGDVSKAQRSNMGSPLIVVVGVAVGLSEVVLEAGAFTILFAITVELAADAVKELCLDHYVACVASNTFGGRGRHIRDSKCSLCMDVCIINKGEWPAEVGSGPCAY